MKFSLQIWRQKSSSAEGQFVRYHISDITPDTSFLEMLDLLNAQLEDRDEEPIAFERDCLEGICGCCSLLINGVAHGPLRATTTCQLYMRHFKDGEEITVEPFRSRAFPVIRDLLTDRSALDRIIQAGGYISTNAGGAPDANAILVPYEAAESAMDAAACIGCGACVASCKNGAAMLFTAAKISQLSLLPQGQPEKSERVINMVAQMDKEGFGGCTNQYECEAVCPKGISVKFIARMNREYILASLRK